MSNRWKVRGCSPGPTALPPRPTVITLTCQPCDSHPLQATGLWAQLQGVKAVFTEPRESGKAFDTALSSYTMAVQTGGGALLIAVCRGKARTWLGRGLLGGQNMTTDWL